MIPFSPFDRMVSAGEPEAGERTVDSGVNLWRTDGQFMAGPSLRETGRVGNIEIGREPADLAERRDGSSSDRGQEKTVHPRAAKPGGALGNGHINPAVVELEARPYVRALRACPIEVARRRQVRLSDIPARGIKVSFTIQTNGSVTGAQALAAHDADDDVLACVGQRMFGWRFTPPQGGPAKVSFEVDLPTEAGAPSAARNQDQPPAGPAPQAAMQAPSAALERP